MKAAKKGDVEEAGGEEAARKEAKAAQEAERQEGGIKRKRDGNSHIKEATAATRRAAAASHSGLPTAIEAAVQRYADAFGIGLVVVSLAGAALAGISMVWRAFCRPSKGGRRELSVAFGPVPSISPEGSPLARPTS